MRKNILVATSVALLTAACTGTPQSKSTPPSNQVAFAQVIQQKAVAPVTQGQPLTMEQIMADPDWIGRQPFSAYWADNSQAVFYKQKRQGSPLSDLYQQPLSGAQQKVALADMHRVTYDDASHSSGGKYATWSFEGNIFVKQLATQQVRQITHTSAAERYPEFLNDGRLVYRTDSAFIAVDLNSLEQKELFSFKLADKPKKNYQPKDYIAAEQLKLIKYIAKKRDNKIARDKQREQLKGANQTIADNTFYLGKGKRVVLASLSPNGDKVIFAVTDSKPSRDKSDIMPNYIGEDSRIKSEKVRRRVVDAKPTEHQLIMVDIAGGTQQTLSYKVLPGYSQDVLAAVKAENAKRNGETYEENSLPRPIHLISDWYWDQSAIQWNSKGDQVAVMLEAWDNKDRWLATVDLKNNSLVNQHRLHDDAWINYKFNSFGWLNNSDELYYLSEESGYAHLYLKSLTGKAKALTQGQYEVDELTLTQDDQFFYFQANKKHPGIYEIYRVNTESGKITAVTDLNGMTNYQLSPDESKLLLNHSKTTQPEELYVLDMAQQSEVKRLTHSVTETFADYPWIAPDIIQVPSSHTKQNIFARIYYPKNFDPARAEKYKAVVFNHGAGYLQNSHLGWSGYFREYMFHNLLTQHDYVVLDMDYRASKGYGRDWRTAIYRQMGTPEVQDLQDGVNWLAENANVDTKRVGTYGGFYGGFLTFMSMFTQPDLFAAGAALRPVTDWAHYNTGYTSNILNTTKDDPIAFERSSPLYFAEGLQKPLLINAPMVDDNVFFVDVVRLVQRLIELEKENFETAIYPVEPHGFKQPSSWLDEYRRIFKLFEENL